MQTFIHFFSRRVFVSWHCPRLQSLLLSAIIGLTCISTYATPLSKALQSADHVLLMRHADAPGIGDPANYDLGNCNTQRNLGERGKIQSRQIGAWLRAQGITAAQVFSSPWCRCIDTGTGLGFGAVTVEPSLGSFFNTAGDAVPQTRALEQFIARTLSRKQGNAIILVTHQVNILQYTGEDLRSGEMILLKVDRQGKQLEHSRFSIPDDK